MKVFQQIFNLATDPEYGNPQMYDIKVKREGEGMDTTYNVIPSPKKKELTDEEQAMVAMSEVTIEAALASK